MGIVHRLDHGRDVPELAEAVGAFLAEVVNPNTHRAYRTALRALLAELGETRPVVALDEDAAVKRVGTWFARRWGSSAPSTINARLDALRSAADWWRVQDWITGDPLRRIRRRPRTPDRSRALDQALIEDLLARPHLPLRDRTLWRMLYETAARADESSLSMSRSWTYATGGRRCAARAVRRTSSSGAPRPPGCCSGCWPGAPVVRCSSPGAAPASSSRPPTRTPLGAGAVVLPAGRRVLRADDRRVAGRAVNSAPAPALRPYSCRTARTLPPCWPCPGTPPSLHWRSTPGCPAGPGPLAAGQGSGLAAPLISPCGGGGSAEML